MKACTHPHTPLCRLALNIFTDKVKLFQDEDGFQELSENGNSKDETIQQKLSSKVVSNPFQNYKKNRTPFQLGLYSKESGVV